ncbi:MAG: HPr-rel-A system PqqD family peptide chaperone [Planctomycetes bacterium]|nr:HPr-rel-A system PqqD family peptide chaperone [Planctomycetota bacterium]
MPADPAFTLWHVPDPKRLLWRCWDDGCIVYHMDSGDTHELNDVAAAALRCLAAAKLDYHQVSQLVCASLQVEGGTDFDGHIRQLMDSFDQVGLIEPVTP